MAELEDTTTEEVIEESVEEVAEEETGEETTPDPEETPAEEKKEKGTPEWLQKKLNKSTWARREAERKTAEVEKDRDAWRTQVLERDKVSKTEQRDVNEPREENYPEYGDYVKALTKFHADSHSQATLKEVDKRLARNQESEEEHKFEEGSKKGREKYDDFDEIALENVPYSKAMREAVLDSENMHDLAYYLGQHLDEADRISRLPPMSAAREIGKIEANLSQPKTKKTTNAPKTINPLGGAGSAEKDPNKMTVPEYRAWRVAGGGI